MFAAGDIASVLRPSAAQIGRVRGAPGQAARRKPAARAAQAARLVPFRPQRRFLSLITTGDKYAVASRGNWALEGRLMWRWKDSDRSALHATIQRAAGDGAAEQPDARNGCRRRGGDRGTLRDCHALRWLRRQGRQHGADQALGQLHPVTRPDILIGLDAPDDAAAAAVPPGKVMLHTVDYFRAFIDDPYVFGQVAANHSLGDIFAMGGEPQSALAIVTHSVRP